MAVTARINLRSVSGMVVAALPIVRATYVESSSIPLCISRGFSDFRSIYNLLYEYRAIVLIGVYSRELQVNF